MKNSYLIILTFVMFFNSACSSDERGPQTPTELNLTGSWKIDHYEVKGKNYPVTGCDVNDQIVINTNKSGTYTDSELNNTTSDCYAFQNLSGVWKYSSTSTTLELEYTANNIPTTKKFNIDAISNNEIRLINNNRVIPGVPATEEKLEIWLKK